MSIPLYIRSYRLSKLAKKFNLSFKLSLKRKFIFFFLRPKLDTEFNFLEGEINGHLIAIYDSFRYVLMSARGYWFAWFSTSTGRATIISINGNRKVTRSFLSGLASIKKINKVLIELQQCKANNHYDIKH